MNTKVVMRYPLKMVPFQIVYMHEHPHILGVGLDERDEPCIWAMIDGPDLHNEIVEMVGTGEQTSDLVLDRSYVGTVKIGWLGDDYIRHVFIVTSCKNELVNDLI